MHLKKTLGHVLQLNVNLTVAQKALQCEYTLEDYGPLSLCLRFTRTEDLND
jgi:hypothetical protein